MDDICLPEAREKQRGAGGPCPQARGVPPAPPKWKAVPWQCKGTRQQRIRHTLVSGQQRPSVPFCQQKRGDWAPGSRPPPSTQGVCKTESDGSLAPPPPNYDARGVGGRGVTAPNRFGNLLQPPA